jgi:methyl-accepting chemotaxis protein
MNSSKKINRLLVQPETKQEVMPVTQKKFEEMDNKLDLIIDALSRVEAIANDITIQLEEQNHTLEKLNENVQNTTITLKKSTQAVKKLENETRSTCLIL